MQFARPTTARTRIKQVQSQETDLLIESMQKLIDHMNENATHQLEIFSSLTINDLEKILQNFEDPNPCIIENIKVMRKTSAAFLCELVYENHQIQQEFCQKLKILQTDGKICVNKLPQNFLINQRSLPEIFDVLKQTPMPNEYPLCWYYEFPTDKNFKKGLKYIKFERNQTNRSAKFRINQMFDPQSCIFGFFKKSLLSQKTDNFLQSTEDINQFEESETAQVEAQEKKQKETLIQKNYLKTNYMKSRVQQNSSSQSPSNQVSFRKPISTLSNSIDFGLTNISISARDHKFTGNLNKTMIENDQFQAIKEYPENKSDLQTKHCSQHQTTVISSSKDKCSAISKRNNISKK